MGLTQTGHFLVTRGRRFSYIPSSGRSFGTDFGIRTTRFIEQSKQLVVAAAVWEADCILASHTALVTIMPPWLVLVHYSCCNKMPQSEWFRKAGMYCLTGLEARNLKSRCQKGHAPSEGAAKDLFQNFLLASGRSLACGSLTPVLAWHLPSVLSVSKFLLFIRTPVILDVGPALLQNDI